jgi:hypothetical protein
VTYVQPVTRFPRLSPVKVALFGVVTGGIYWAHWFETRARVANALAPDRGRRIPPWLTRLHFFLLIGLVVLAGADIVTARRGGPELREVIEWVGLCEGLAFVALTSLFRDRLRSIHGTGSRSRLSPSITLSVALGPLYFQYLINKSAYETAASATMRR